MWVFIFQDLILNLCVIFLSNYFSVYLMSSPTYFTNPFARASFLPWDLWVASQLPLDNSCQFYLPFFENVELLTLVQTFLNRLHLKHGSFSTSPFNIFGDLDYSLFFFLVNIISVYSDPSIFLYQMCHSNVRNFLLHMYC